MSLPRYPEYKDSGVAWLGEVPGHWEIVPVKNIANIVNGYPFDSKQFDPSEGYPLVRIRDLNCSTVNTYINGDFVEQAAITSDDVLIGMDGDFNVGRWCGDGVAMLNQRMCCVRGRNVLISRLLEYALPIPLKAINDITYSTTVKHLSSSDVEKTRVALPREEFEQQTIAAFLDRETGKIDALIAEQQRLVELLNEEIISLVLSSFRAPQTSELRLSEVATIISRPVIQKADESYTRIGLFNRGRGLFHKDASEMDEMGESNFFWVEEDDLIISGQFAWEGAVALAGIEDTGCVVSHRYPVIRGKTGVALTEYLLGLLWTKHGDFLLNENSRGAAGRNRPLNISSLMKEKVPVPSMEIQKRVARAVHARKALFKEVAKAIDLLQERRSALISAAVTGKIDVRTLTPSSQAGDGQVLEAV